MPSVVLGLGDTTSQRGQGLRGGVGLVLWGLVGHVKRSGFLHGLKSYWKVLIERVT